MDNRTVHGHIHNYKDFTLVHGHLHTSQQNDQCNDEKFKHFEFINVNKDNSQLQNHQNKDNITDSDQPKQNNASESLSLKMLMEECHCDPQIIEICCDNSDHHAENKTIHTNELEPIKKKQKTSKKDNKIQHIPKDLLFLDDCNTENKQTSKDVVMNFLDISKMYDIPILNKTHGKIVHQENLLDVGFTKKDKSLIEDSNKPHNHHHHKLELHTHGIHNQHKHNNLAVDNIKDQIHQEKHSLDCTFACEDPNAASCKVKSENDKNHLDFEWNDFVAANKESTLTCKWENCHKKFGSLMELHSHLIFDHLENSKKSDNNANHIAPADAPNTSIDDERCFWDNCGFEYQNDCDMIDHINDAHGIQFNIKMDPLEIPFPKPTEDEHSHRHNVLMLPQTLDNENICKWKNCGIICKSEEELDAHLATHVPSRQAEYECHWSGCGKFFKQRQKILRHLKSHSKYKGCVCDICKKPFSTSDVLLYHKKKMHAPENVQSSQVESNIVTQ